MTDIDRDGAALALCVAHGDREGARLLLAAVDDAFPIAWWLADSLLSVAPGTGVLPRPVSAHGA